MEHQLCTYVHCTTVTCPPHRVHFWREGHLDKKGRDPLDVWGDQASAAKGRTKGTGQQAPRRKIGAMADHACGAGAGSHGECPIGTDVGHGAAGSKRQREQEEDQGMAGEDLGMHMTYA